MWIWESNAGKGVFIIVHGANEYHARYLWLIEKLVADGYHVVMGDLPGQGLNPKERGHIDSFQEYIETIVRWYERAQHYQLPLFILGHSMGGLAVIEAMRQKKLDARAIILSSPCLGLKYQPGRLKQASAVILDKLMPKLRMATNLPAVTRCHELIKRDEGDRNIVKKVSVRWYRQLITAMANASSDSLSFPDVPLLVLQGGDDLIVDKKAVIHWFNQVPLSEKYYKEFAGLYHEVFNEPEKEDVYKIAKEFANLHLH